MLSDSESEIDDGVDQNAIAPAASADDGGDDVDPGPVSGSLDRGSPQIVSETNR
jgi:hypothetical protein